jgi:hypothetical protein
MKKIMNKIIKKIKKKIKRKVKKKILVVNHEENNSGKSRRKS